MDKADAFHDAGLCIQNSQLTPKKHRHSKWPSKKYVTRKLLLCCVLCAARCALRVARCSSRVARCVVLCCCVVLCFACCVACVLFCIFSVCCLVWCSVGVVFCVICLRGRHPSGPPFRAPKLRGLTTPEPSLCQTLCPRPLKETTSTGTLLVSWTPPVLLPPPLDRPKFRFVFPSHAQNSFLFSPF